MSRRKFDHIDWLYITIIALLAAGAVLTLAVGITEIIYLEKSR